MTLALSDFISPEEMKQVKIDVNDNLVVLEESLLQLERQPADAELINSVFRAMHSIKGIAGMFGLDRIAAVTHHIEDVYDLVRKGKLPLSGTMISLTLTARDLIFDLANHGGANVEEAELQRVEAAFVSLLPGAEAKASAAQKNSQKKGDCLECLFWICFRFHPDRKIFDSATNPMMYLNALRALGECKVTPQFKHIPELAGLDPSICYIYWEVALITDKSENEIRDEFIFIEDDLVELSIRRSTQDLAAGDWRTGQILLERGDVDDAVLKATIQQQKQAGDLRPIGALLMTSGKGLPPERVKAALAGQQMVREKQQRAQEQKLADNEVSSIRVPSDKLDLLVNQVGELVIAQARLNQLAAQLHKAYALQGVAEEISLLTENLRDNAMSIRMLPIGSLFQKFNRLVRDISQSLGKRIRLVTVGGETELDKTVIEGLSDPLVHLIRNSVDHGIESPAEREAAGKDPEGVVRLSAIHAGANVVVRIEDDGKGLNPDALRAKAVEKGLIHSVDALSDREAFNLIFAAGLSTKTEVTNLSGRGVGMDVVKKSIETLRGTIQVESEPGRGCVITISLPLTLAIIDGFLVESQGERYVIPLSMVRECVRLTQTEIKHAHGEQMINIRNEIVPYIRLRDLFRLAGQRPDLERVVITETDNNRLGLVVDHVLGQNQVVIKSLGEVFRNVSLFSGATILGDGSVVPILDVARIVDRTVG